MQLSSETHACLVDLVALAESKALDAILTSIFTSKETICIGFGFGSDISMLQQGLPKLQFYRHFENFIDVQAYYKQVKKADKIPSLALVVEQLFKQELCKGEQMSNWELRPLRLSQQHYGALDAFCLIQILHLTYHSEGETQTKTIKQLCKPLTRQDKTASADAAKEDDGDNDQDDEEEDYE